MPGWSALVWKHWMRGLGVALPKLRCTKFMPLILLMLRAPRPSHCCWHGGPAKADRSFGYVRKLPDAMGSHMGMAWSNWALLRIPCS
jgi:hypothetical protein